MLWKMGSFIVMSWWATFQAYIDFDACLHDLNPISNAGRATSFVFYVGSPMDNQSKSLKSAPASSGMSHTFTYRSFFLVSHLDA